MCSLNKHKGTTHWNQCLLMVTPQTQIFRKYQQNDPFVMPVSTTLAANRSTSSHLSQPDTPPHHTQASPFTRKPWKDSCKPLSTLPVAIFVQQNCNRAPKHGGGPWWQDIWEISAIQYVVFATYPKEIRNRKEMKRRKKTGVHFKILPTENISTQGVSRQQKKNSADICYQDA